MRIPLERAVQKVSYCCNAPGSDTELPSCNQDPVNLQQSRTETQANLEACPNLGCPIESVREVSQDERVNYRCILRTE